MISGEISEQVRLEALLSVKSHNNEVLFVIVNFSNIQEISEKYQNSIWEIQGTPYRIKVDNKIYHL
jgi:hypothetical protein